MKYANYEKSWSEKYMWNLISILITYNPMTYQCNQAHAINLIGEEKKPHHYGRANISFLLGKGEEQVARWK